MTENADFWIIRFRVCQIIIIIDGEFLWNSNENTKNFTILSVFNEFSLTTGKRQQLVHDC